MDSDYWVAFPEAGKKGGEGGDCYAVAFFDNELDALRYVNRNHGYRAVAIKSGQTILAALKDVND
ncbi:hypothetical protein ACFRAQ_36310 [Nocardia sp. NPDC056611]|uniref:hypothetical protein n=1 Tax=Nocardia sp. NPDC056611 TaxID=3345877 RepID=UPI0036710DA7